MLNRVLILCATVVLTAAHYDNSIHPGAPERDLDWVVDLFSKAAATDDVDYDILKELLATENGENIGANIFSRDYSPRLSSYRTLPGKLDLGKTLIFIFPGLPVEPGVTQSAYKRFLTGHIGDALLQEGDYTVVYVGLPLDEKNLTKSIQYCKQAGFTIGNALSSMYLTLPEFPEVYVIADDIGNFAVGTLNQVLKEDYKLSLVYALNQRTYKQKEYDNYYVRRSMADTVNVLNYNGFPYSYGTRNFFPVSKNATQLGNIKMLSEDILKSVETSGTLCPNEEYYLSGKCSHFERSRLWRKERSKTYGDYYFDGVPQLKRGAQAKSYFDY